MVSSARIIFKLFETQHRFVIIRRLYPVDKNRLDDGHQEELETVDKKTK